MSLIEMSLNRRRRSKGGAASVSHYFRPEIDQLEARECMTVAAPTLQLAVVSPTQVKLTWNDVLGEAGYRVYQWNGTQSTIIATLGPNATTYTANNLTPNQVQWFTVQAFDGGSNAFSSWATIKTPVDAITAPTNVKSVANTLTSVTLTWNDTTGETGYRIYVWDGAKASQVGSLAANTTTFKVPNLNPGQSYYFYVQAFNATNSAASDWISASTQSNQLTGATNLQAQSAGADKINLSWTDGNGETGYRVYRWDGDSNHATVLVTTLAANATSYQATGLLAGSQYWFYVQSFNAANTAANTGWVSAMTTSVGVLQAPTPVRVDAVALNSVVVTWTEPPLATGYTVWAWSGSGWVPLQTVGRGTNSVRVDNLPPFRTYWFIVESFTGGLAQVAYSNAVFVNL